MFPRVIFCPVDTLLMKYRSTRFDEIYFQDRRLRKFDQKLCMRAVIDSGSNQDGFVDIFDSQSMVAPG